MKKFEGNNREVKNGYIEAQDETCIVYCDCEDSENDDGIWVGSGHITRCHKCGKGYMVEFVVWQYDVGEEL